MNLLKFQHGAIKFYDSHKCVNSIAEWLQSLLNKIIPDDKLQISLFYYNRKQGEFGIIWLSFPNEINGILVSLTVPTRKHYLMM